MKTKERSGDDQTKTGDGAALPTAPCSRILPAAEPRVETGPVQFGDDWPGTFFRGDTSFYYAFHLAQVLEGNDNPMSRMILGSLLKDLRASNIHANAEVMREGASGKETNE